MLGGHGVLMAHLIDFQVLPSPVFPQNAGFSAQRKLRAFFWPTEPRQSRAPRYASVAVSAA